MPEGPPDERFVYLSDVLPTAWQAVEYADVPDGGSVVVLGLGPDRRHVDAASRCTAGRRVIGVDLVPERLPRARAGAWRRSTSTSTAATSPSVIREMTDGRGPDAVIDAVGMEAHGAPVAKLAQQLGGPAARRASPSR